MTLALNTSVNSTPFTSVTSSSSAIPSLMTVRVPNFPVWTLTGTTPNARFAYPCQASLINSSPSRATRDLTSPSYPCIRMSSSPTAPRPINLLLLIRALHLMRLASNASRVFSAPSYVMESGSTINFSLLSAPSAPKKPRPLKPPLTLSTNSLTMFLPTQTTESPTVQVIWSLQATPTPVTSTRLVPASILASISSSLRMTRFFFIMAPFSPSPISSISLFLLPKNLNSLPCLSSRRKWFPYNKHPLKFVGRNQLLPFKLITPTPPTSLTT